MANLHKNDSLIQLQKLYNESRGLKAVRGLDCPERQLHALKLTLTHKSLKSNNGSQIVLLTDAPSHDLELVCEVIRIARAIHICISFFLSLNTERTLCNGDKGSMYHYISNATGGRVLESISQDSFRNFNATHNSTKCASFYGYPRNRRPGTTYNPSQCEARYPARRKRAAPAVPFHSLLSNCHTFNTSIFTASIEVVAHTVTHKVTMTKPTGESAQYAILYGNFGPFYSEESPPVGEYRVCVETTHTFNITVKRKDVMDSIVKYLTPVENSTEFLTTSNNPLPGKHLDEKY